MNQNKSKDEIVSTSSQPSPSTVTSVSNKRPLTDTLTDLLATQKQHLRHIRRRNSIGDLPRYWTQTCRQNPCTYVIQASIQVWVDSHVKPLIETINKQQQTISDQEGNILFKQ
jgi:hypothetical protein